MSTINDLEYAVMQYNNIRPVLEKSEERAYLYCKAKYLSTLSQHLDYDYRVHEFKEADLTIYLEHNSDGEYEFGVPYTCLKGTDSEFEESLKALEIELL